MADLPAILVLGVGGNVSQGILKALAVGRLKCRVVGACISAEAAGLYSVDKAYISPLANSSEFLGWLLDVCRRERICGVLSGVEPVLAVLAEQHERIVQETGATCVVSRSDQLAICQDKLAMIHWLQANNLEHPQTADAAADDEVARLVRACGYPLVAKPRHGKGSEGVLRITNAEELAAATRLADYVIQEHLGDERAEFTASAFSDRDGNCRGMIVMQRRLQKGTTSCAEVGEFPRIRETVARIVAALRPTGPCNVQLRTVGDRPIPFEINLRYSGTTPIRARFGFNDVEAGVRHFCLHEPAYDLPLVTAGMAVRYWNEFYISAPQRDALERDRMLDHPADALLSVEDYGIRN